MLKERLDLKFHYEDTNIYYNLEIDTDNCNKIKFNLDDQYLCMIDLIVTNENHRNKGSGKRAIKEFIKYMNEIGVHHFYLFASFDRGYYEEETEESLKRLVRLYKGFGFIPFSDIENNDQQIDMYLFI